jgi:hypothetical protein
MYIACTSERGRPRYVIRESFRKEDGFGFRDLCDLGEEPGRFIVYPGGNAFYVDGAVEDRIASAGGRAEADALEDIFWPFLRPEIRRRLDGFRNRERRLKGERIPAPDATAADVHDFDRRRIHFLKCGRMDLSGACRIPASAVRALHGKSRDEIEQGFIGMESALRPREVKAYAYAIFDLQRFFSQRFAKQRPELLDVGEVDAFFLEEACRLNRDRGFWRGAAPGDRLDAYLVRYLFMYFDHDYAPRSFEAEYVRDFMNRHREHRPPSSAGPGPEEISRAFGRTRRQLEEMGRSELAREYRRRAQELHPDKGGEHERFVKLTEAYHQLLRTKR